MTETSKLYCNLFKFMADEGGFEPPMRFNPHTHFPGVRLQPLGHPSNQKRADFSIAKKPLTENSANAFAFKKKSLNSINRFL